MADSATFAPAWASPPGRTIAHILDERSIDPLRFAAQVGISEATLDLLLAGDIRIDAEFAHLLSSTLGGTSEFWLLRDEQYLEDMSRLGRGRDDQVIRAWLQSIPTRDMVKWGWINADMRNRGELLRSCLAYFDVDSIPDWEVSYGAIGDLVAFRRTYAHESSPSAVAAWLRKGEIIADGIQCASFDRGRLAALIPYLRTLTRIREPSEFLPLLIASCAGAGVAVAIVRAPAKCGVSGAARFLNEDKALVQLSFRYRSDDHFWFTFFHEIGHLMLHGRDAYFLEGQGLEETDEEREANDFSGRTLIPADYAEEMISLGTDFRRVMRFAKNVGVSPGIVVGQMQHLGALPRNYLNKLKVRYEWA